MDVFKQKALLKKAKQIILFFFVGFFITVNSYANITVGTIFFNPPFVFNIQQGFDIDLINTLCQRMKVKCDLISLPFDELFSSLQDKKIDLAIGGLTINEERLNSYIFSTPYLLSRGQFLSVNQKSIQTINDLKGKNVGVFKDAGVDSVFYDFLETNYASTFNIIPYANPQRLIADIGNASILATFVYEATALYWTQNSAGSLKLLGEPVTLGIGIGIAAMPDNDLLIQQINQTLQILEQDGTYLRLYRTYLYYEH